MDRKAPGETERPLAAPGSGDLGEVLVPGSGLPLFPVGTRRTPRPRRVTSGTKAARASDGGRWLASAQALVRGRASLPPQKHEAEGTKSSHLSQRSLKFRFYVMAPTSKNWQLNLSCSLFLVENAIQFTPRMSLGVGPLGRRPVLGEGGERGAGDLFF